MPFSLAARMLRACLALALTWGATAALAGGGPLQTRKEPVPAWNGIGSADEAWLVGTLAAMAPQERAPYLRARAERGGSAVLLMLLAREEARQATLADAAGDDDGARQGRWEAVRHGLAAYVAMRTAAPLCSDRTSPDEYLRELGEDLQPLLAWLGEQDAGVRSAVADAALALETKLNAPGRPDPMLCRRGLHGDRFCAPGAERSSCPVDSADMAEFTVSEPFLAHQFRVRQVARGEVKALAR